MATDDGVLLTLATDGDTGALRTLLERHGARIWTEVDRDIGARWRSALDADDVMQVTYMEAFLRIRDLAARDAATFVAWLRRIAQNNLRDAIKELERKKRPNPAMRVHAPVGATSYVTLVEVLGANTNTPSRHVAQQEAADIIDEMLQRIPPDYAKVVKMYDLEGKPIGDVADAMNRSTGAVHMLRARAHERLRSLLGAETDFFTRTM
jgi:RNA polymerase sigma-70 factor (subfamily 1)